MLSLRAGSPEAADQTGTAAHQQQRTGRNGEAHRVQAVGQPDPQKRFGKSGDQQPGHGRPDEPHQLIAAQDDRIPRLQIAFLDQHRHDAVGGRDREPRHQPEPQAEDIQHPQVDVSAQHGQRHQRGKSEAKDIGDDHDPARREPVGDRSAQEHEHRPRDSSQRDYDPQHQGIAGELQHEPGRGDQRELIAQNRGGRSAEQQAEIHQGKDAQHGVFRRRGIRHRSIHREAGFANYTLSPRRSPPQRRARNLPRKGSGYNSCFARLEQRESSLKTRMHVR